MTDVRQNQYDLLFYVSIVSANENEYYRRHAQDTNVNKPRPY